MALIEINNNLTKEVLEFSKNGYAKVLLVILIAYLIGSIQTSYLIGKIVKKTDIRKHGSGNAGSTNALRVFGKKIAFTTLAIDILKGVIATVIGNEILGIEGKALGAIFVVIGHNFPFYLKFKGGKGVATTIGSGLMIAPISGIISIVLGVSIIAKTKYVSLGALIGVVIWPILTIVLNINNKNLLIISLTSIFLTLMIIFKHRSNIKRLLDKNENKISFSKKEEEKDEI